MKTKFLPLLLLLLLLAACGKSLPAEEAADISGGVTVEAAKASALSDAGLTAETVHFQPVDTAMEHGELCYVVVFTAGESEYRYRISAFDGFVLTEEIVPAASATEVGEGEAAAP